MTIDIKLERDVWQLDESQRLGPPGGFGEVFRGRGKSGHVAIKRLMLTASAAAHREMNIGKVLASRELNYVVPVLDYGQDAETDRYYLVMPICDHSLQDLVQQGEPLEWETAKRTALDIIEGLKEVRDIVHRDLKPGNVLWHEGRWRVADFGIAKFVEDSTSLETLRNSLTPSYAAPEQWLGEPPTRATDVYALGCIFHAMLNGRPPFNGDIDFIRRAHLNDPPPALVGADARLSGLVQFMLRKRAASRPSLERCATVIESIVEKPRRLANQALVVAGNIVAQEEAVAEARRREEETAMLERAAMAKEAIEGVEALMKRLFDEIQNSSEAVRREARAIVLGPAYLTFSAPKGAFAKKASSRGNGWDVVAYSAMSLKASIDSLSPYEASLYTFSATLAFARTREDQDYRWRELSFFNWHNGSSMQESPIALSPTDDAFQMALSNVISGWQLAHGPLTIDAEDEGDFQERWINLFAKAAQKKLRPPSNMPLLPSFFQ